MNQESLEKAYQFIKTINEFKSVERLSLIKENGRRESDAEHTWHLVMAVVVYSHFYEGEINLLKAIKMALIHDLVEIEAGDVFGGAVAEVRIGKEEKEKLAAEKLFSALPSEIGNEFLILWNEYEEKDSEEAKFVWALDKLAPRFQLTITKKDLADDMPTDNEKVSAQEEKIREISPALGIILDKVKRDRGI